MKGIVVATHGALAAGMMDAVRMLSGEPEQMETLGLIPEQGIAEFAAALKEAVDRVDSGDGVMVFCDLLFGSPCNCAAALLRDEAMAERVEIVTGANFPMVLEYVSSRDSGITLEELMEIGRDGIVDLKSRIKAN